jgi:hypothetical protein
MRSRSSLSVCLLSCIMPPLISLYRLSVVGYRMTEDMLFYALATRRLLQALRFCNPMLRILSTVHVSLAREDYVWTR